MIHKTLPGEGGDGRWFANLNAFEQQETKRQIDFKRRNWPKLPDGRFSKQPNITYPHILPEGELHKSFWSKIAEQVLNYCADEDIAVHSEALNLRSSQVCCFNFMFPLRQDLVLAKKALLPMLPGVEEILGFEFEYTGPQEQQKDISRWLGEPASGKRGQNRTSIDVAIFWKDREGRRCLTLAEWKYTERQYGDCGGFRSTGNTKKEFCQSGMQSPADVRGNCYLTVGRNTRTYWDNLGEAGIDIDKALAGVEGCPFRGPFYQLLRQYLLAARLRQTGHFDSVDVVSIGFRGNANLEDVPAHLVPLGQTVIEAWNSILLPPVPRMRHVYVEDIMNSAGNSGDPDWREYIRGRYGV